MLQVRTKQQASCCGAAERRCRQQLGIEAATGGRAPVHSLLPADLVSGGLRLSRLGHIASTAQDGLHCRLCTDSKHTGLCAQTASSLVIGTCRLVRQHKLSTLSSCGFTRAVHIFAVPVVTAGGFPQLLGRLSVGGGPGLRTQGASVLSA